MSRPAGVIVKRVRGPAGRDEISLAPGTVIATALRFVEVVEVRTRAHNVHFYSDHTELPSKYEQALEEVR